MTKPSFGHQRIRLNQTIVIGNDKARCLKPRSNEFQPSPQHYPAKGQHCLPTPAHPKHSQHFPSTLATHHHKMLTASILPPHLLRPTTIYRTNNLAKTKQRTIFIPPFFSKPITHNPSHSPIRPLQFAIPFDARLILILIELVHSTPNNDPPRSKKMKLI